MQLIIYGAVIFAVGLLITVGSYAFAHSRGGGTYVVSYGPMIIGLISIVRGVTQVSADRKAGVAAPGQQGVYGQPGYGQQGSGQQGSGQQGSGQRAPGQRPAYDEPGYARPATASAAPATAGAAQPARAAQPPSWYPDPRDPSMLRWWDGQAWTAHTQPRV